MEAEEGEMINANVLGSVPLTNADEPLISGFSISLLGSHQVGALGGMAPFKWISGAEDRKSVSATSVQPWSAVGVLNLVQDGQLVLVGSGFMCAPDVFLTARHNLLFKPYSAAGVWIAYDHKLNRSNQVGIAARAWHATLDLAVLVLAKPQASVISLGCPVPASVSVAGYGIPYADGSMCLSTAAGSVTGNDGLHVGYAVNTQPGDSGAPVLAQAQDGAFKALAVHKTSEGVLANSNFGTILNEQAIADIHQLIKVAKDYINGEER